MVRVRLDLESILTTTTHGSKAQSELREETREGFAHQELVVVDSTERLYVRMDQRISQVEALIRSQAEQMYTSQSKQLGSTYEVPPAYEKQGPPRSSSSDIVSTELRRQPNAEEAIGIRATQFTSSCGSGCYCACHKQESTATPKFVNRVLGQLFIGYAGMPLLSPKCDSPICQKAQSPSVSLEYWFPLGFFWSQIVRLQIAYRANLGPQTALNTLRQVPDSSPCVEYALSGNIDGLKELFQSGTASPVDVSSTRGYSLLRVSLFPTLSVLYIFGQ